LDHTHELEDQVQRLTGEVGEMRARMARLESGEPGHENGAQPKNRRGFLKFGAGAILGALGMAATKVVPAAAATGQNWVLGQGNAAGIPTNLTGDTTVTATTGPNPVLQIQSTNFSQAKLTTALTGPPPGLIVGTLRGAVQALGGDQIGTLPGPVTPFEGIDAVATGATAYAVYGLTDMGTAVVGESNTGIGLHARRSGRLRQDPAVTSSPAAAPSYAPNQFEQVRDSNGVLWIHGTTGAAPAIWRRVNTPRFDTSDGTGGFFVPLRLLDTRSTGMVAGGSSTTITVTGAGTGASKIPLDAIGIAGNLTAVLYLGGGFLTIFPAGQATPSTATVNMQTGQSAIGNGFIVGLGAGGAVTVYNGSPQATHFVLDITAYFQ
jgi:hypothetical protein